MSILSGDRYRRIDKEVKVKNVSLDLGNNVIDISRYEIKLELGSSVTFLSNILRSWKVNCSGTKCRR